MAKNTVDDALGRMNKKIKVQALDALVAGHHRQPHTEVAKSMGVSETAVRRWRKTNAELLVQENDPKILIWDIESSPILGYVWGLWEQNVLDIVHDWKLLTVSWTWYGSGVYQSRQLCDMPGYRKGSINDKKLAIFTRDLLDQADYSVAHNGNAFDVKKVNAKFAEWDITPPSPHTQIDTLRVAKANMKMSSNRLDSLGNILGVGRKIKHAGFQMWLDCMAGDPEAWEQMRMYAEQDVILLESVFEKLLPWVKGLNYGLFTTEAVCTNCGSSDLILGGLFKTQVTTQDAWQCADCGTWSKQKKLS